MTVYRPAGRRYYVMDFVVDGRRIKRSTKRTNRKEALLVEVAVKRRELDSIQMGKLRSITLRKAVQEWWLKYGSKLRDSSRIEGNIRVMFGEQLKACRKDRTYDRRRQWQWDGKLLLHDLSDRHLKACVNARLSEGIAAATITAELSIIRRSESFHRGAYATPGYLNWPTSRTDKRLIPNKKSRFLRQEEIIALFEQLDPNRQICRWPDAEYRTGALRQDLQDAFDLAVFLLHTGCRPSEALQMPWDDIDLETRTIEVRRLKSLTPLRTGLVMSDVLHEMPYRRFSEARNQYVFPDRINGGPRRQCRAIKRAMDRAGLNELWKVERYGGEATTYTLRDTYASLLAQSGRHTLHEIRDLLGHTNVMTTQKYARLLPQSAAKAAARTLDSLSFK
ncbi:MAG: tyrosine-type recombinase/integrase [Roseibium aggregatum]